MRWKGALAAVAVLAPGGAAVAGGVLLYRRWRMQKLSDKLDAVLPARLAQWAPQLASAALDSCPLAVSLDVWAFTFAGIIDRESGGGIYLTPRGPTGTGDHGHGHGLGQVDDRPAKSTASDYEQQLSEKRLAHIASGDWQDPRKHLRFCAVEVLRGAYMEFPEVSGPLRLACAAAAYNGGVDRVRTALDASDGQDVAAQLDAINSVTTGDDYAQDVLTRATNWADAAAA